MAAATVFDDFGELCLQTFCHFRMQIDGQDVTGLHSGLATFALGGDFLL